MSDIGKEPPLVYKLVAVGALTREKSQQSTQTWGTYHHQMHLLLSSHHCLFLFIFSFLQNSLLIAEF